MIALYTAIGHLELKKNQDGNTMPTIINGHQIYGMSDHEIVLWSCLAFQILNIHELKAAYELRLQKSDISEGAPFEYYLNRLLFRGLIAKGESVTAVDALYRLLGVLQIYPVDESFLVRLFSCIFLCLKGKLKFKEIIKYLKEEKLTPVEDTVLALTSRTILTTAELITCIDKGIHISSEADMLHTLYTDSKTTYSSLAKDVQIHHIQYPVLQAIGNLYLNKKIAFMRS